MPKGVIEDYGGDVKVGKDQVAKGFGKESITSKKYDEFHSEEGATETTPAEKQKLVLKEDKE